MGKNPCVPAHPARHAQAAQGDDAAPGQEADGRPSPALPSSTQPLPHSTPGLASAQRCTQPFTRPSSQRSSGTRCPAPNTLPFIPAASAQMFITEASDHPCVQTSTRRRTDSCAELWPHPCWAEGLPDDVLQVILTEVLRDTGSLRHTLACRPWRLAARASQVLVTSPGDGACAANEREAVVMGQLGASAGATWISIPADSLTPGVLEMLVGSALKGLRILELRSSLDDHTSHALPFYALTCQAARISYRISGQETVRMCMPPWLMELERAYAVDLRHCASGAGVAARAHCRHTCRDVRVYLNSAYSTALCPSWRTSGAGSVGSTEAASRANCCCVENGWTRILPSLAVWGIRLHEAPGHVASWEQLQRLQALSDAASSMAERPGLLDHMDTLCISDSARAARGLASVTWAVMPPVRKLVLTCSTLWLQRSKWLRGNIWRGLSTLHELAVSCNVMRALVVPCWESLRVLRSLRIECAQPDSTYEFRCLADLPPRVSHLHDLEDVRLPQCTCNIPASWLALPHLHLESRRHLEERQRQLAGLAELQLLSAISSLACLRGLKRLNLHRCQEENLPDDLGSLPLLTHLTIHSCPHVAGLPASLPALAALRSLRIQECATIQALPDSIHQLPSLQELHVQGCPALRALPCSVGGLLELRTLKLIHLEQLTALPPQTLHLPRLQVLVLRDCPRLRGTRELTTDEMEHTPTGDASTEPEGFLDPGAVGDWTPELSARRKVAAEIGVRYGGAPTRSVTSGPNGRNMMPQGQGTRRDLNGEPDARGGLLIGPTTRGYVTGQQAKIEVPFLHVHLEDLPSLEGLPGGLAWGSVERLTVLNCGALQDCVRGH